MLCTYKNGILKIEIAKGSSQKTLTLNPCLIKGKIDSVILPDNKRADYYLLCTENGDYILSNKYVINRKIAVKSKLIPLGTRKNNTFYSDIKKQLEESPLGAFATVKRWKT
jgi:hypothetical protein